MSMTAAKAWFTLLALLALPSIGAVASEADAADPAKPAAQQLLVVPSGRELDSDSTQQQPVGPPPASVRLEPPVCTPAQALKQTLQGAVTLIACRSSRALCPAQGLEHSPECVLAKGKL